MKRRDFCKCFSVISLYSLFPNLSYANSDNIIIGELYQDGQKITSGAKSEFENEIFETNEKLSFIKNGDSGYLIRPNSKVQFLKNKIHKIFKGSLHGIFGKQTEELVINTPRGTIGIRGTATYIEHQSEFDRTYVCNCYGKTNIYDDNSKLLKVIQSKYHSPIIINKNYELDQSPYNYPLNHFDDNIENIEKYLNRTPNWELPDNKKQFLAADQEKLNI